MGKFWQSIFQLEHPLFELCLFNLEQRLLSLSYTSLDARIIYDQGPRILEYVFRSHSSAWLLNCLRTGNSVLAFGFQGLGLVLYFMPQHRTLYLSFLSKVESPLLPSERKPFIHPLCRGILGLAAIGIASYVGKYALQPLADLYSPLTNIICYSLVALIESHHILFPRLASWILKVVVIGIFNRFLSTVLYPARSELQARRIVLASSLLDLAKDRKRYTYSSLQTTRTIRLMSLEVQENASPRLICDIFSVSLDDAPPYEAVSYSWGNSANIRSILIGSDPRLTLDVTESVYQVLQHLTPLSGKRYLWLDNICIDQDNKAEKIHQIPLMRAIYSNASKVIGYLSEGADVANAANIMLQDIAQDKEDFAQDIVSTFEHPRGSSPEEWLPLRTLLENSFFQRRWIVQECVLAKDISLCYGGVPVSWTLLHVLEHLPFSYTQFLMGTDGSDQFPMNRVLSLLKTRESYAADEKLLITRLVFRLRFHQTSVPHDSVYALLGITSRADAAFFHIDYDKDIHELYTDLVEFGLSANSFLSFAFIGNKSISYAESQAEDETLPSWIPDWRRIPDTLHDTADYHIRGYNAGTNRQAEYRISKDRRQLELTGVYFDILKECTDELGIDFHSAFKFYSSSEHRLVDMIRPVHTGVIQALELASKHCTEEHYEGNDAEEVLWRTLFEDYDGESYPADKALGTLFQIFRDTFFTADNIQQILEASESIDHSQAMGILKTIDPDDNEYIDALQLFFSIFSNSKFFSTHKFAITATGYMAIVPPGTMSGDVVAVMQGSPVPHILRAAREDPDCYKFCGECYVHGIMQGEAFAKNTTKFVLI